MIEKLNFSGKNEHLCRILFVLSIWQLENITGAIINLGTREKTAFATASYRTHM